MNKRERFLADMQENILLPYEAAQELYEEMIGEFENSLESAYFTQFVNHLHTDAVVLDLACGDGRHTLKLAEHAQQVVGLDHAPKSLQLAQQKCAGKNNITFQQGSILAAAFAPNTFDGIWFSQAFEYVPPDYRDRFLASLRSALKPTGILYMTVETWLYPRLADTLKTLWRDARLFSYWKFVHGKPLLWGEFLYRLPPWEHVPGWHYHVHTDRRTLAALLARHGFTPIQTDLSDGYIYTLCS